MTMHVFLLCLMTLGVLGLGFVIGRSVERRRIYTESDYCDSLGDLQNRIHQKNVKHADDFTYCLGWLAVTVLFLVLSYDSLRNECIERYKKGDAVETITYHYEKVNNIRTLKDSTVTYSFKMPK